MTQNNTIVEKVDDEETPLFMVKDDTEVARITKEGSCIFNWDLVEVIAGTWTPGTDDLMTCICKMLVSAKNVHAN